MEYTKKEKAIQTEIERLIPGLIIHPVRVKDADTVKYSFFRIATENSNFINSQYSCRGSLKFVHFTNLFALEAILNSKSIRLYNLYNLSDPREYSFAGDLLTFNKKNRDDAKKNMYLFSMCKDDILTDKTEYEFNMWRLYGQNGNGACIQFDFSENPQENWHDYFLSEVFYGASSKTNLKALNILLKKYENEKPETEVDLGQIVTFHKSNLYKLEKEVRLLFDNRVVYGLRAAEYFDASHNLISPIINSDITRSVSAKKDIKYIELPIYHENFNYVFPNWVPVPKIEKIILGFSYKSSFKETAKKIAELSEKNLGYKVVVEQSRLTKYYYER